MKTETQWFQIFGTHKSTSKTEVYSDTGLPKEITKNSSKSSTLISKRPRKRRANNAQSQQKEVIKIKMKINATETKKQQKNQ